jgi:hypothetical protein
MKLALDCRAEKKTENSVRPEHQISWERMVYGLYKASSPTEFVISEATSQDRVCGVNKATVHNIFYVLAQY